jgi:hypothetical protein
MRTILRFLVVVVPKKRIIYYMLDIKVLKQHKSKCVGYN